MNRVTGFGKVYAHATTGTDTSYVYGASGDDQLHCRSNWGQITQWNTSTPSYSVYFQGFDSVTANSTAGSDGYDCSGLLFPVTYLSASHWITRAG